MEHKCVWQLTDETRAESLEGLKEALTELEAHDDDDDEVRDMLIMSAVALASVAGLESGFSLDMAYIELPTGQVGWFMPTYRRIVDHTPEEKHERIRAFLAH